MGRGYFGVVTESCDQKKAFTVAALDLFTAVREARPEVIGRLLRKDYDRVAPQARAYAAQSLATYR
jgi:hypothetical protein